MGKPLKKRLKNNFIFGFVFYLILFIRLIRRETAFWIFEKLGRISYYLIPDVRRKMVRHLTIAFGEEKSSEEIGAMVKESLVNLGRNAVDAIRLPVYSLEDVEKFLTAEGLEILDRILANGKSVVLITGHIGSWEMMAAYLAMKGYPLYVVGARLYDPRLDHLLLKMRKSGGYINISREGSTKELLRILKKPNLLGMLIDQDTRVAGTFVRFFGKQAYTPVGPVILAAKTGAALVPLYIHLNENYRHHVKIFPEYTLTETGSKQNNVVQNTQGLTTILENFIREVPTQWVWMHERWKTRPEEIDTYK